MCSEAPHSYSHPWPPMFHSRMRNGFYSFPPPGDVKPLQVFRSPGHRCCSVLTRRSGAAFLMVLTAADTKTHRWFCRFVLPFDPLEEKGDIRPTKFIFSRASHTDSVRFPRGHGLMCHLYSSCVSVLRLCFLPQIFLKRSPQSAA